MPRRRLAVVIMAPPEEAVAVDVLRRAVRVPEPFHVAPHCTLVPPTNVPEGELDDVVRLLRAAVAEAVPFALRIGPATTFLPETPTLHLAVGGEEPAVAALHGLRAAVRSGPLDRPDVWPFHPHVTIDQHRDREAIPPAVEVLAGVDQVWHVDRIHLLEHRRRDDGSGHWVAVRDEPFGGPSVVGRGGLEVALRTVGMVGEPEAALCGVEPATPTPGPGEPRPLAVLAEPVGDPSGLLGAAVGAVAVGGQARLDGLAVREDERAAGVGAHLLAAWCSAAARAGADLAVADGGSAGSTFLTRHGFQPVGDLLVRRL